MPRNRRVAILEGACAGVFFGTASILIRLLPALSVFSIALGRLIVASVALAVLIVVLRMPLKLDVLRPSLGRILLLGFLLGSHFILFISSVRDTSILNATVLVNTAPILAMAVSALVFKVRPSRTALVGSAVSLVGIAMIVYGDASEPLSLSFRGDLEAVLAALAEAFYLNYGRELRRRFSPIATMPLLYLVATVPVVCASFLLNTTLALPIGPEAALILIGLGIVPTALAHTLYFSSLSDLRSFETATLALLEPIGATLLGIVLFLEIPGTYFLVGASIVLAGVFLVLRE
ncbi:MAG: DMT family transporter [Candidatus Bathyarchaeia archaeon]